MGARLPSLLGEGVLGRAALAAGVVAGAAWWGPDLIAWLVGP